MGTDVFICSPLRTAIGTFDGSLKTIAATQLGATVIRETLKRAALPPEIVQAVVMPLSMAAFQFRYQLSLSTVSAVPERRRLFPLIWKLPVAIFNAPSRGAWKIWICVLIFCHPPAGAIAWAMVRLSTACCMTDWLMLSRISIPVW